MKYDSKGKIKRFKVMLVANGVTQRDGIDYKPSRLSLKRIHLEL
jgi:hypothetical protein